MRALIEAALYVDEPLRYGTHKPSRLVLLNFSLTPRERTKVATSCDQITESHDREKILFHLRHFSSVFAVSRSITFGSNL